MTSPPGERMVILPKMPAQACSSRSSSRITTVWNINISAYRIRLTFFTSTASAVLRRSK